MYRIEKVTETGWESAIVIIAIGMFLVESVRGCQIVYDKFRKKANSNYQLKFYSCAGSRTCNLSDGSEMKTRMNRGGLLTLKLHINFPGVKLSLFH